MHAWIFLVVISQVLQAIVVLLDKVLVSDKQVKSPLVYAFYASIMSGFVIVLVPFLPVQLPDPKTVLLSIASAVAYLLAIWSLYHIFKESSTIESMPMVSAVTALSTILISAFAFSSPLKTSFFIGSLLLVFGSFLIARYASNHMAILLVLVSGVSFASSSVFMKMLFEHTDFVDGFVWSRIANVLVALLLLLVPRGVKTIKQVSKNASTKTVGLVVFNKFLAGVVFLMYLAAINMGDVSVVNALSGLQFAFLFIFAWFFAEHIPQYFRHELTHRGVVRDMVAVASIIIGFAILFI